MDIGAEQTLLHESQVYKLFGAKPNISRTGMLVKGVGEDVGMGVVGELVAKMDIDGSKLEDLPLVIMPLSMNMSSPLILGMEFLRRNKFTIIPEDRVLSNRLSDGSGFDWIIDEDGNPIEIRIKRSKCVMSSSVEIEPYGSVSADIVLDDAMLRGYLGGASKSNSKVFLIESLSCSTPQNVILPDGLVSASHMRVMLNNDSSTVQKIPKGTLVGVATTVLEVEGEEILESWDLGHLRENVKLDHLDTDQGETVMNMLADVSSVFSKDDFDVNAAAVTEHIIHLTDDTPYYTRPRRLPEPLSQEIERQCLELEAIDIIERSVSPWSAPVVPLRKGDGSIRMCIDYRRLNAQTKPDRSPIPCMTDAVYSINQRKFFTSLDLVKGYYQLPLAPESRELTAFSTAYSHFQFKRLSFGLRNAPATFQREIQSVLSQYPKKNVIVYFDDILIMEDSFEAHAKLVSKVLHSLASHGMKIKPSKCKWFEKEVDFLGHTISSKGLRKQDSYVKKVDEFPRPGTVKELQQFLGLVNFQRKFVQDASIIQRPLSELTGGKRNSKIEWTTERLEAFEKIKALMRENIELAFPCYDEGAEKLVLWVDASDDGCGGCLMQKQDGEDRVIAYASMTFGEAQRRYATVEKELAALRWAVKSFKAFLYGIEFVIRTDHQPLVYLHRMRVVDNRLARTLADLSEFNFSVEYVPGESNTAADALSRLLIHPSGEDAHHYTTEIPCGLEIDGDPSPGGGDSLLVSLHRWLIENYPEYALKSSHGLREQLISELVKFPNKYGIKNPSKDWRRQMKLGKLPGQLPPVEILLVCSFFYRLKIDVYYWSGDPVTFVDWRTEPVYNLSLQCLGGVHYNLLRRLCQLEVPVKPVFYVGQPTNRGPFKVHFEVAESGIEVPSCSCRTTSHPCASVSFGGKNLCAVLDTGAEISLIRRDVFEQLARVAPLKLDSDQVVYLEGYSGLVASVTGAVEMKIELPNGMVTKSHTFAVVDEKLISHCLLLGIDFLAANSLAINAATDNLVQTKPQLISRKLLPYLVLPREKLIAQVSTSSDTVELQTVEEPLPPQVSPLLDELSVQRVQENDPTISKLREYVSRVPRKQWPCEPVGFYKRAYDYQLDDGLLYCKFLKYLAVVVSWDLLVQIATCVHLSLAHIGRDKMLHLLRQHIFHPNLYMVVRDICQSCPECQVRKVSRQVYVPPTLKIVTSVPFELVAADVVLFPRTSEGFIGCIILVDHNSKWVSAVPIKNKTSKSMVDAVRERILPFLPRCPTKILTDNGTEFSSREFNQLLEEFGIQHVYTTPYRPQSNGCIERVNRTIGSFLRSLDACSDWTHKLTSAVMVYNNTLHQAIGMAPSAYLLGKSHEAADLPAVSTDIKQFWKYGHSKYDAFEVGQSVIRKIPVKGHCTISKFKDKYDGPYKVVKVNRNELTYVIEHLEQSGTCRVHHSQLGPWVDPPEYLLPYLEDTRILLGVADSDDAPESDDSISLGGGCVLALSSESEAESLDSTDSHRSSANVTPCRSSVLLQSENVLNESTQDCELFQDINYDRVFPGTPVDQQTMIKVSDGPIFSDLDMVCELPSSECAIVQDLPVEDPLCSFGESSPSTFQNACPVQPSNSTECIETRGEDFALWPELLGDPDLPPVSSAGNIVDEAEDEFAGFLQESVHRYGHNQRVLASLRGTSQEWDLLHDPEASDQLHRGRTNSSPTDLGGTLTDNPMSEEVSSILDWDMQLLTDEATSRTTPSPGFVHDQMKRTMRGMHDAFDDLLGGCLISDNSGSGKSNQSVPSVSTRTPIINDKVLSRMRTRSEGPVENYPNVMPVPLERKNRK